MASLLYRGPLGVMAVNYTVNGEAFVAGKSRVWAEKKDVSTYDLAPDGKRLVVVEPEARGQQDAAQVTFLLNDVS